MVALSPATQYNQNQISAVREFEDNYSIEVGNDAVVSVIDRTNNLALAKLQTKKDDDLYLDPCEPSHFYQGKYYFVLSSNRYTKAKFIYCYDLSKRTIKHDINAPRNVFFYENLLINCGIGFNVPGPSESFLDGSGIVHIYDLTITQGKREVYKEILKDGCGSGWDASIDEATREIKAFDHVNGNTYYVSFSKYLKA